MLNITRSDATTPNPNLNPLPRQPRENNAAWIARALPEMNGKARLALFGGKNRCAFRLRVSQSHARSDLTPSHWSHVALLEPNAVAKDAAIYEISLERGYRLFPPATNGVQTSTLYTYANTRWYPNVCVLELPMAWEEVDANAQKFQTQRNVSDAVELVLVWLAYVWGVGRAGNPLLDGNGMPSSVLAEYVIGASGFDLTPGLASRSSCPEAIWQSARWWHEYHESSTGAVVRGAYCVNDRMFD